MQVSTLRFISFLCGHIIFSEFHWEVEVVNGISLICFLAITRFCPVFSGCLHPGNHWSHLLLLLQELLVLWHPLLVFVHVRSIDDLLPVL